MSYNLLLQGEHEGGGRVFMKATRFSRGLTHTATLSVGDFIKFPNGEEARVDGIRHHWHPGHSDKAPMSEARAILERPLTPKVFDEFLQMGFES